MTTTRKKIVKRPNRVYKSRAKKGGFLPAICKKVADVIVPTKKPNAVNLPQIETPTKPSQILQPSSVVSNPPQQPVPKQEQVQQPDKIPPPIYISYPDIDYVQPPVSITQSTKSRAKTVFTLPPINKSVITLVKYYSKNASLVKLKNKSLELEKNIKYGVMQFAGIIMYLLYKKYGTYDSFVSIDRKNLWSFYNFEKDLFEFPNYKGEATRLIADLNEFLPNATADEEYTTATNIMFFYMQNIFPMKKFEIVQIDELGKIVDGGKQYMVLYNKKGQYVKIAEIVSKTAIENPSKVNPQVISYEKTLHCTKANQKLYEDYTIIFKKYLEGDNARNDDGYEPRPNNCKFQKLKDEAKRQIGYYTSLFSNKTTVDTLAYIYQVNKKDKPPIVDDTTKNMNCAFLDIIPWCGKLQDKSQQKHLIVASGRNLLYSRTGKAITTLKGRVTYLVTSISTSVNSSTPFDFISNKPAPILYFFSISPKAMNYVFPVKQLSDYSYEDEIILPLSTKLEIADIKIVQRKETTSPIFPVKTTSYLAVYANVIPTTDEERELFRSMFECPNNVVESQSGGSKNRCSLHNDFGFIDTDELQDIIIESFVTRSINKLSKEFKEFITSIMITDVNMTLYFRLTHLGLISTKYQSFENTIIKPDQLFTGLVSSEKKHIIPYVSYNIPGFESDKGYISFEEFRRNFDTLKNNSRAFSTKNLLEKPNVDEALLNAIDKYCLMYYDDRKKDQKDQFILQKKAHAFLYFKHQEINKLVGSLESKSSANVPNSFCSRDLYDDDMRIKALKGLQEVIIGIKNEKDIITALQYDVST